MGVNQRNLPTERLVLGRALLSESDYWVFSETLRAEHFSNKIYGEIYRAVGDILREGKKMSLQLVEARVGAEYEDGKSTASLISALVRDVEAEEGVFDLIFDIVESWQRRKVREVLEQSLKDSQGTQFSPGDVMAATIMKLEDVTRDGQASPLRSLGAVAANVVSLSAKTKSSGKVPGFDTGLPSLDEILGRIHVGDLGVIGARSGDGKTVLGLQLAQRAALFMPALFFELEMTGEDLARRVVAGESNLSVSDVEEGAYDFDAYEAIKAARDNLANSQVYIDERPKIRIDQIRDRCISVKRSKGLGLVVIDHLRLVGAPGKFKDKFDRIEHVTGAGKALAKDVEVAVIVLSQVTRMSQRREDGEPPRITDFDGGSSIEQDADWAIAAFRRDRWLKTHKPLNMESKDGQEWLKDYERHKGRIQIVTRKSRRMDDGEMREFLFDGRRGRINEMQR